MNGTGGEIKPFNIKGLKSVDAKTTKLTLCIIFCYSPPTEVEGDLTAGYRGFCMFSGVSARAAYILSIIFLASSSIGGASASLLATNPPLREEAQIAQRAILELLDYRIYAVHAVQDLEAQIAAGKPLRGDQLEPLHQNIVARTQIKEALILKIRPYLELVNHPESVKTDDELFHYLMTLAVGYTLTDNYQDFVETIQNNSHLRHIANEPNSSFDKAKNLLRKTVKQFYSVRFHRPTLRGARRFAELNFDMDQKVLADPELEFFWTIIESSATFDYLRKQNDFQRVTYDIGFFFKKFFGAKKIFKDIIHQTLAGTVNKLSMLFGNTAGLFQSRRGYLYRQKALEGHLLGILRPGDVLIEKTPFRLTDKFIPGYWGHNAIWLGTEEELKALGIWEDPAIQAIADRIHEGQSILEALRPGVTTNRLEHFMDVDSFAILRRPKLTDQERRNVILRAARQYGKDYDFGFDVETQDALVCSELMFMAFTDVNFHLEKTLGRFTIEPDAVAELGVTGTFDIVTLIQSGAFAFGDLRVAMAALLK